MTDPTGDGGAHRSDGEIGTGISEPVVISHVVSAVAWLISVIGWAAYPGQASLDIIATVVAAAIGVVAAIAARARVSPTGKITWAGVRSVLRQMVYEEIDRLAATSKLAAPAAPPAPSPVPRDNTPT